MSEAIVLVGLSGTGKSAVGRCLAARLGRPFVDLDELVERRSGRTPAQVIEGDGEVSFRRMESEAVAEAVMVDRAVIATGGGAILDPLNRWALWDVGTVVWLDAPDEMLLERLEADGVPRPMLEGNATGRIATLRRERAPFYRAADHQVEASEHVDAVTEVVERHLESGPRPAARRLFDAEVPRAHPIGPEHARIVFGRDLDAEAVASILARTSTGDPFVVVDERVAEAVPRLVRALGSKSRRHLIRATERRKRLRSAERLLEHASDLGMERTDAWIGVGGGTTTDLVGTAAALYHRGAPLINVPTTWLGQADAALGGKQAVDLARAKNAAGAFWPPVAVIADVVALRTLPRSRLLDGMAESLKSALIGDAGLWELIEERGRAASDPGTPDEAARYAIVERSARLKLGVVERDPYERGERRTLNLGHTLGHALEIESGYRLPHGQAVVLGIRAVAAIAQARGAQPGLADRIDALVSGLGYPMHRRFDARAVKRALTSDKKRHAGRQRWILPMDVGRVQEVDDVTVAELDKAMKRIAA